MRTPADGAYEGDLVIVARRFNPIEAALLRGRLVADGIPATLGDAHTVQTDSLLTAALGGVRIRVPAAYEARALCTIAALEQGAFMLDEDDIAAADAGAATVALRGDAAGFAAARRAGLGRLAFGGVASLVFLGLLAAFAR